MTAPAEIIIKKTALAGGSVVTIRVSDRHALRPFLTCVIDGDGGVSQAASFSCAASALQYHATLVKGY